MKPLPASSELEVQALAAVMIDPEQFGVLAELPSEAFASGNTRQIFDIMRALHAEGQPVDDHALILNRAQQAGTLNMVDTVFLAGLLSTPATGLYGSHYAEELRALYARRQAIRAAHLLIHHATEGDVNGEELATLASKIPLTLETRTRQGFTTQAAAISQAMTAIRSGKTDALETGFVDLDAAILGLEPGALYVLAARPAMGKSALAYDIVTRLAKNGVACVVGSLEMPAAQLATRALATASSTDLNRIRHRNLNARDLERLNAAEERLKGLPITYLDSAQQTINSFARDARKLHAQGRCDFLMLDYLQLLDGNASDNRVQEISVISRGLKRLALELNIPVLALSQLSRAVEQRPNKRPQLSDLRESGSIEQDADVVMFIYRDEYYNTNTDQQGVAEIIIGKQRSGPVGTVKLSYLSAFVRFGNLAVGGVA